MICTQKLVSVLTAIVITTTGVAFPTKVEESDVEPPTVEPYVEVVESEPIETIEKVEVVEVVETEPIVDETKSIKFKATAYCPCSKCCGKWSNGITATGVKAKQGRTIAVDPKVIPYGTEVIINGNTYVAEDCGGAIKGNRIDIYFDSHQKALDFGVQYLEGVIIK